MANPRKRVQFECEACGVTFEARPSDGPRRFCSNTCSAGSKKASVPPREELVALYYEQGKSTNDIADHYGVSKGTIYNWFRSLEIETRSVGDGVSKAQTGKHHSAERKEAIGRAHKGRAHPYMVGDKNPVFKNNGKGRHGYRQGYREDLGIFVRSSWEANVCRWLNWRVEKGQIQKWEYEPTTFTFVGVTRGAVSYTPDFRITHRDGSEEYLEVKGYETSRDRTKYRRVRQFYPDVVLKVLGADEYRALCSEYGGLPQWERPESTTTGTPSEPKARRRRAKG